MIDQAHMGRSRLQRFLNKEAQQNEDDDLGPFDPKYRAFMSISLKFFDSSHFLVLFYVNFLALYLSIEFSLLEWPTIRLIITLNGQAYNTWNARGNVKMISMMTNRLRNTCRVKRNPL